MENNESYVAGWDWAGDALTWMSVETVEDSAEGAAQDMGADDPEMVYEGIMARLRANSRKVG
jgi:hypothetical protein